MTIGADVVAAVALILAGIVWLVRLEGRISRAEERHTELLSRVDRHTQDWATSVNDLRRELKEDVRGIHKRLDAGKVFVFKRSPQERGDDDDT